MKSSNSSFVTDGKFVKCSVHLPPPPPPLCDQGCGEYAAGAAPFAPFPTAPLRYEPGETTAGAVGCGAAPCGGSGLNSVRAHSTCKTVPSHGVPSNMSKAFCAASCEINPTKARPAAERPPPVNL